MSGNVIQLQRSEPGRLVLWEKDKGRKWKVRVFIAGREIGYAVGTRGFCRMALNHVALGGTNS